MAFLGQRDARNPAMKFAEPGLRLEEVLGRGNPLDDPDDARHVRRFATLGQRDQHEDYPDDEPPEPAMRPMVNLKLLEEDTTKDRVRDLALQIKALTFDEMMEFVAGVCPTSTRPHELAPKVSSWAGKKLNPEETPDGGEKVNAIQNTRQDARPSDPSEQEVSLGGAVRPIGDGQDYSGVQLPEASTTLGHQG